MKQCKECKKLKEILRNIVDVLCDYDLIHSDMPLNYLREFQDDPIVYGLALDDIKKLFIFSRASHFYKRQSVVHEILHVVHYKKGDLDKKRENSLEKELEAETKEIINLIYTSKNEKNNC